MLRHYLREMPEPVIKDIVADYEEHFEVAKSKGKTEEEISEELGSPRLVADEFLNNESRSLKLSKKEEQDEKFKKSRLDKLIDTIKENKVMSIVILVFLVFVFPTIFGIGVGLIGGLFGLVVGLISLMGVPAIVSFALGISLIAAAVSFIVSIVVPGSFGISLAIASLNPLTKIFMALAMMSFGLIILGLGIEYIKFLLGQIKKLYIFIKWEVNKEKRSGK
ncbi:hypothetical protein ING2D1G_1124 [Peptoniphilus sp. ING2-D1G]|nr:hypothetical protein ING2D1G_1124 [Peptoniphilus sp. ING2-D1G]